jgi:ankyrin repeat protein
MSRAQKQHFNKNADLAKKLGQELAQELNQNGANPYEPRFDGWKIDEEKCLRLIAEGADVTTSTGGLTPLMCAALHRNIDLVAALLKAGAPVNTVGEPRATALSCAMLHKNCYDIAVLLVNAGADPRITDRFGNSPLSRARDKEGDLRFLIQTAADYKDQNKKPGKLGIQGAARGRHLAELLAGSRHLLTPEKRENIQDLLDERTDFSQQDKTGGTPLMCAISWCHGDYALDIIRLAPHTVNIRNKWDRNALLHCAQMQIDNRFKITELLLAAGADATICDYMEQSVLDIATEHQAPPEIYTLFQKAATAQTEKLARHIGKHGIYSSHAITPLSRLHLRKPVT